MNCGLRFSRASRRKRHWFFPVVAHTPPPEASFPKITFSMVCNIHMPLRYYKACPHYSYTGMQQGLDYSRSWHLLVRILLEISEQEQDFCYLRPRIKRDSSYCQTEAWWKNNIVNINNNKFQLWVKNWVKGPAIFLKGLFFSSLSADTVTDIQDK